MVSTEIGYFQIPVNTAAPILKLTVHVPLCFKRRVLQSWCCLNCSAFLTCTICSAQWEDFYENPVGWSVKHLAQCLAHKKNTPQTAATISWIIMSLTVESFKSFVSIVPCFTVWFSFYVLGLHKYNDFSFLKLNFDLFKSLEFTEDKELSNTSWMAMFILGWLEARCKQHSKAGISFPLYERPHGAPFLHQAPMDINGCNVCRARERSCC